MEIENQRKTLLAVKSSELKIILLAIVLLTLSVRTVNHVSRIEGSISTKDRCIFTAALS